jgi:hypothetical protein
VTRDPQIERFDDDLGATHRGEAARTITAGAAFVILCVAALVAVVAGAYWLIA